MGFEGKGIIMGFSVHCIQYFEIHSMGEHFQKQEKLQKWLEENEKLHSKWVFFAGITKY